MESYIIRIYRRDGDRQMGIAGTVEEVGAGSQNVFHSSRELIAILGETNEDRNTDSHGSKQARKPSPDENKTYTNE